MPITRQFEYLPGSSALGEDVSAEFDAIISFLNDLETDKLDVVGGTVATLEITDTLEVGGESTFNDVVNLGTGIHVVLSDTSLLKCGNPTVGVSVGKAGILVAGTSGYINMTGSGTVMAFSSTGGVTLGASASITTTNNTFSESAGLLINGGTSKLTSLALDMVGTSGAKIQVSKASLTSTTLVMKLVGLPTSDPAVSGQIWNNAGVLTVSP